MLFEWDPDKDRANQSKHFGLDFETASRVFNDPNYVLIFDRLDEQTGEQRWHAIGLASAEENLPLLLVVHVYRSDNGEEIIRIISARKANQRERGLYLQ